MSNGTSPPSPPSRKSFSKGISAMSTKLSRAFSNDSSHIDVDQESLASTKVESIDNTERSLSRGREAYHSSGRGGIGNIRQSSTSRDAPRVDGPDDFSQTRGREPAVDPSKVFSTGRGGAGNIRSPSRDGHHAPAGRDPREEEIIRNYNQSEGNAAHSSGRGGLGNISRSRSRGPGSPAQIHSTGRGGVGNMVVGELGSELVEVEERIQHTHPEGIHSTGRGGLANLISSPGPGVEYHGHNPGDYESTGRGGAGNIRERSSSRGPDHRSASKEKHGISGFIHKVTHPHPHHSSGHEAGIPEFTAPESGPDSGGIHGNVL